MTQVTKPVVVKPKIKRPNRYKIQKPEAVKAMMGRDKVSKTFAKNAVNNDCKTADDYRQIRNKRK